MKSINDVVIERLCKFMGERNLTQYKLSQLSGVPFPTIKSIMQHRTKGITLKTIIMIADGLGMTPSEFLDHESFLAENLELE
ncbi:MAG: helix-turn-helix transcriptional regulator [Clostridia bacterium]|nr:helix-turn-helix transcriptional regulator [Clostridia bacterium]